MRIWFWKGDTTSSNAKSKGVLENVSSACGSGKLGIDICAHDSSEKDNTTANSNSQTVAARNASVVGESSGRVVGQMTQTNAQKIPISTLPVLLESMWKLLHLDDTIAEYEKMAKQKREEKLQQQEGAELSFFNKLGHIEKVEILNGIADFKD
ncbi:hypothetical protein OIU78_009766, partial [Salix suchowensis]